MRVTIDDARLFDIADAIRSKLSVSSTYLPSQMPSAIMSIQGGGDTSDATLSNGGQMLSGVTAYASGIKYTGTIQSYAGSVNSSAGYVPYYSGSYVITPTSMIQTLPTNGMMMSSDMKVLSASGGAILGDITISSNGSYSAAASGFDGFANVVVSVPTDTEKYYIADNEYYKSTISVASFSKVLAIGTGAFQSCSSLTTASFPQCRAVSEGAFRESPNLSAISFPECLYLGNNAFHSTAITSVSMSKVRAVDGFNTCTSLVSAYFSSATAVSKGAFGYCTALRTVSIPKCATIGEHAFNNCTALSSISMSLCTTIDDYAFYAAPLTFASFSILRYIGSNAISMQSGDLWLANPYRVCVLDGGNDFGSAVTIHVPSSILSNYQSANNWSRYSSQFVAI